jgi:hypothetical protein
MGTVFKPFVTRPLPDGARIVTRKGKPVAEWLDAAGKKRQAPVTAGEVGTFEVLDDATIRTRFGDRVEVMAVEVSGDTLTMRTAEGLVTVLGRAGMPLVN